MNLNASNASKLFHVVGPQCLQCIRTIPYYWTSMPPRHPNYSILLDLNASKASELFHMIGPQCLQCMRTIPYYWTSMHPMHQNYSIHPTGKGVKKSASQPSNKQGSEPASGSWRLVGRLKAGFWGGGSPPRKIRKIKPVELNQIGSSVNEPP